MSPLVSVIVPTRNSASFLKECLHSIREQTYQNIEIIVVDNYSTDETLRIASSLADNVLTAGPERSAQMNAGAVAAQGQYLYRVDSDFVVEPEVVAECVELCERGADAVAVHNDSDERVGFWAAVRAFEREMYRGDDLVVGARFFRASAYRAVGGFDEELIAGEDYDIHNRLVAAGYRVARANAGEIHLGEPRSLREIIVKSWIYGKQLTVFVDKNRGRGVQQLNPVRAAYFRNWRKFLRRPVMGAAFTVMQAVKYSVGGAAYFGQRLKNLVGRKAADQR